MIQLLELFNSKVVGFTLLFDCHLICVTLRNKCGMVEKPYILADGPDVDVGLV